MMKTIKPYLIEFIIVTAGVLIALFLSNLKESNQARKYHFASIETINTEVQDNYSNLKRVVKTQSNLLDTLIKYTDSPNTILEIFDKSYGFQIATLHNTGLDFYKKNQINSIDFKIMSTLIDINFQSRIIDSKIDQLIDLIYSVPLDTSKKTKLIIISHLRLVLSMEKQMIKNCEDFIIEYVKNKNNAE